MRARFLWHVPYLEGVQGVLGGVRRGPAGPPEPLELAALASTAAWIAAVASVLPLGSALKGGLVTSRKPRAASGWSAAEKFERSSMPLTFGPATRGSA